VSKSLTVVLFVFTAVIMLGYQNCGDGTHRNHANDDGGQLTVLGKVTGGLSELFYYADTIADDEIKSLLPDNLNGEARLVVDFEEQRLNYIVGIDEAAFYCIEPALMQQIVDLYTDLEYCHIPRDPKAEMCAMVYTYPHTVLADDVSAQLRLGEMTSSCSETTDVCEVDSYRESVQGWIKTVIHSSSCE
jgi:hypothetical protein